MRISDWSSDVCSSDHGDGIKAPPVKEGLLAALCLLQMPSAEQLRDLHGIERRALAAIIGYAPQGQPIFHRGTFADAADISIAVANAFYRRVVTPIPTLVDEPASSRLHHHRLCLLTRNLVLPLIYYR